MKVTLLSETSVGKWAAIIFSIFIVLILLKIFIAFPMPNPFIVILGVAGVFLGSVSIIKHKDRSFFTLLSIPVGILLVAWVITEIIFPQ